MIPGFAEAGHFSDTASRRSFLKTAALGSVLTALDMGVAAEGAPPALVSARVDSDVGTLFPFIESQSVRGEPRLSFLNESFRSVKSWRKKARARLLELLHYAPPSVSPQPDVLERIQCDGYVRERIQFNTTPHVRVPAFVLVPDGLSKPAPAIVALHDHGGFYLWGKEKIVQLEAEHPVLADFRQRYYGGKSIAIELVRRGYVVVVIDMFYWGERRMLLAGDGEDWLHRPVGMSKERVQAFNSRAGQNEQLVGRTIYSAGFTWPGVMFWDDIRTVDYLVSRPDVDRNRIGCVGLSVGGLRSCHLAALDERIKAGVVVGWMASFPRQLKRHVRNTIGHTKVVPGLYRDLDYPDVASLAVPRPLLVVNGLQDGLFDLEGVKESFAKLKACYRKAGVPDRCETLFYDGPHEFNLEMQGEAWKWLARWV